jgi:hypothetical protein
MIVGHHPETELPVKKGDVIRLKKGTAVKSFRPKGNYTLARAQDVKVFDIFNGISKTVPFCERDGNLLKRADCRAVFEKYDELILDSETHPDSVESDRLYREAIALKIHESNPTVHWVGAGGYWCWVDINDVIGGI